MKFENIGIENKTAPLVRLDEMTKQIGFVRAGQWDYERVTYDYKFENKGEIFYLRVQGYAVEGDIGSRRGVIKLLTPLLGKHYYPHGVEYGEDEDFPNNIVEQSKKLLSQLSEALKKINAEA